MELTPIKIRLKRRRKGEAVVGFKSSTSRKHDGNHRTKKRSKSEQRTEGGRRLIRASYFEKEVPLEVLERIFWLSENINLPLASLRFGRLLSGRPTLRESFISAFAPTWEIWHGCVKGSQRPMHRIQSYAGWEDDSIRWGGSPDFQSAILKQPWSDINMILDSEQSWRNRFARGCSYEHTRLWGDTESYPSLMLTAEHDLSAMSVVRRDFLMDYMAFREVENLNSPIPQAQSNTTETHILVHKDTQIPDDLLTGPWDNDHVLQKLFWLVRAGARLSNDQTWEVTLAGFRNAVQGLDAQHTSRIRPADTPIPQASSSTNLTVIRLLCILGAFREWPRHVVQEQFDRVVRGIDESAKCTADTYYKYSYLASQLKPHLTPMG